MSDHELGPLPDDIRQLLQSAAPAPLPEGFEARLRSRVASTLAASPGPGEPLSQGAAGSRMGSWGVPVSAAALIAGLAAGTFAGATLFPRTATAPPSVAAPPALSPAVPAPPAPPSRSAAPEPRPAPEKPAPRRALPPPAAAAHEPAAASARDIALSDERGLLEQARTAFSRREPERAAQLLDEHQRRFPRGQLVEEREVLLIQLEIDAGQLERAREHGRHFKESFPESLLLPAVEASLQATKASSP